MSTEAPATTSILPATDEDIEAAAHVYQEAAEDLSDRLRANNPWDSLAARSEDFEQAVGALRTLRQSDDRSVVVARNGGEIVGMSAVSIQHPHAHIAFFFVKPSEQNQGIGRAMLARLRERIDEAGASVITLASSRDPKAWRRYMQFGLAPGPPQLPFRAKQPDFPIGMPEHGSLIARPIEPGDQVVLAALDRISGRLRAGDHGGALGRDRPGGRAQCQRLSIRA